MGDVAAAMREVQIYCVVMQPNLSGLYHSRSNDTRCYQLHECLYEYLSRGLEGFQFLLL